MVTSSSPYAPITSASPYAPIAISCAPCEPEVKPAVSEQKVIVLPALKLDHDTTCTTCTTCPTLEKPVSTTAATAKDDWRQSWDKADEPKAPAVKPEPRTVPFSLEIPHADAKKPDPLQMPETFLPVMEKTSLRKAEAPKKLAGSKEMYDWSGGQGADKGSRLPPGTQSVVEAGVIAKGPVQYVPVPIVTMPDMSRPPRAPQPFGEQNGAMANAYGSPSKALGPNMTTNDESMVNAFTSLPSREMVAQASNAFTDGASTAGPQPVMPAAAQPMYPRSPYGMMAQAAPAMPSTAMTPQGVMPVGYQAPMSSDPRMVQSAAEQQMLAALHGSLFPSQREWAAEGLATLDWRIHPEIVQALVTAAREDPDLDRAIHPRGCRLRCR